MILQTRLLPVYKQRHAVIVLLWLRHRGLAEHDSTQAVHTELPFDRAAKVGM